MTGLPGWTGDLAINVAASLVWTLVVPLALWAYYLARVVPEQRRWIRDHGLMLWVYFRNIDWRCEALRTTLTAGQPVVTKDLLFTLEKLKADLHAFDQLAVAWSQHLDGVPLWHPYARQVRAMVEAEVVLRTSLLRHIDPTMWLLNRVHAETVPATEGGGACPDSLGRYLEYFMGGRERLWMGGLHESGALLPSPERDAVEQLRSKLLTDRLQELLQSLQSLLDGKGLDLEKVRIWHKDTEATKSRRLWFAGNAGNPCAARHPC